MKRRPLLTIALLSFYITLGSLGGHRIEAAEMVCVGCHSKLYDKLPSGHPEAATNIKACGGCHPRTGRGTTLKWLSHFRHFSNEKFKGDCWSCHQIGQDGNFRVIGTDGEGMKVSKELVEKMVPHYQSWAVNRFMGYQHAIKKVSCEGCHETLFPDRRASQEKCLKCHVSYEKVAELTEKKFEHNPHNAHSGEIRCTLCHRSHAVSVIYCAQCHNFEDLVFSKEK